MICIIVFELLLSGCWNSIEINKVSFVTAIGIDKTEGGIIISIQIAQPSQVASENSGNLSPITVFSEKGESVIKALRKMTKQSSRNINLSHLKMAVIGEDVAKDGILNLLDYFLRNNQIRTDYYIVISKGVSAKKVLSILTPLEQIPANKIFLSLEDSESIWATTKSLRIIDLINSIVADGMNPVISGITISGNAQKEADIEDLKKPEPSAVLKLNSIGAFKEDKLVGWLNEDESKGYNYIIDNVDDSLGCIEYDNSNKIFFEITDSKTKITATLINGSPMINIDIENKAKVIEVIGNVDVSKQEVIKILGKLCSEKVEFYCKESITKAQQDLQSDIFGFGEIVHKTYPESWKKIKNDWNSQFVNVPVNLKVNSIIEGLGAINKPFSVKE